VFAYYPDNNWLKRSRLLTANCGGTQLAQSDVGPALH